MADLDTATIQEIGDQLRARYECFVLVHTRVDKLCKDASRFNFDYGGTVGGIHNAIGLLEAAKHQLLVTNFRTDPDLE